MNNVDNRIKLEEVTKRIGEIEAEENRSKIMTNFKEYINVQKMWKILKRMWPKGGTSLPVAKKNFKGKIVTAPKDIKNLLAIEYKNRLRSRPIRPDLVALKHRRQKIFKMKMKLAHRRKSSDWTLSDIDKALSDLKNNKSRDPQGYINEIFKHGVIGYDMKKS